MLEERYRSYLADNLRIIGENTAKIGGGSYIKNRWKEEIKPKKAETRTAGEIITSIKDKLERLGKQ